MIKITDKHPIRFERIVKKTVDEPINKLGFIFEGEFPSTPEEDSDVAYSRMRKGIYEGIYFVRKSYWSKIDDNYDDEIEKMPYFTDKDDSSRYSRHLFRVSIIVNHGGRELLTTGKAGIARTEKEEYWYFEDEEDLQKLLKGKIVPLLRTVVMKGFDEQLKDELEYLAKYPKAKQQINK